MKPAADARVLNNVVFCLDLSRSMMSPFGDGTRSDKAMGAITDFTTHRKGDAFGLTVFGTEVLHWVPVTKDVTAIASAAPFLRPDRMPSYMGGTMIGHAVRGGGKKRLTMQSDGDRMIVLISDGDSFDLGGGAAQQIGEELVGNRITLFYIHVAEGSPQEETMTMAQLSGGGGLCGGRSAGRWRRSLPGSMPCGRHGSSRRRRCPWIFSGRSRRRRWAAWRRQMAVGLGLRFNPW